jgi:hypothetical protein
MDETEAKRSVNAFVLTQPFHQVLYDQLLPFQFHDSQIIDRRMGQAIRKFSFERLVFLFQFREVRLHRHAVCLLNTWTLPEHLSVAQSPCQGDGKDAGPLPQ